MPTVLSLFSGAGGAVEGFKNGGYDVVAAVDFDEDCIATLERNHDDVEAIHADLSEVGPAEFAERHDIWPEDVDVVVGGPPCKDFSKAQSNRTTEGERANLVFVFAEYVNYYRPEAFVMENVDALTTIEDGEFFEDLIAEFDGYTINHDVLSATDYGVPQKRHRTIVIGHEDAHIQMPEPTVSEPTSVSETLDHLPDLNAGEGSGIPDHEAISHRDETVAKMEEAPHGVSKHPAYARAYPSDPAFTVVGGNASPAIHHEEDRRYTVRECALLQSFSQDYVFTGTRKRKYQMVGNASPPKMMKAIAESL